MKEDEKRKDWLELIFVKLRLSVFNCLGLGREGKGWHERENYY